MAAPPLMSEQRFWALVEGSRERAGSGPDRHERQREALVEALAALPAEEIVAFDARWRERASVLSRHPLLWAAIHAIEHGCDDDRWQAFQGWLIGRGRAAYERSVDDADALGLIVAEEDEDAPFAVELAWASDRAYEHVTGAALACPDDVPGWDGDAWQRRLPRIWSIWGRSPYDEPADAIGYDDESQDAALVAMVLPLIESFAGLVPMLDDATLVELQRAAGEGAEAAAAETARRAAGG